MATNLFTFYVLSLAISSPFSLSESDSLTRGSSLSVEKADDVLTSQNGIFSAGFFPVGINAYCFAIWFNEASQDHNGTVVWVANRDKPVNGKGSKLSLREAGDLVLTDTGGISIWATGTFPLKPVQLHLNGTGNLVLLALDGVVLWQSFDSPTDTILTNQPLTRNTNLVSSRRQGNFSSGFYRLLFDDYDVLRLNFKNNELSSIYWPPQWALPWDVGRVAYNRSTFAWLDPLGYFESSDKFNFTSDDYGSRLIQRRLRLDYDGNLRLYSRKSSGDRWVVSWQAFHNPCKIHGICGHNSLCTFDHFGRKCSCLPGHKMKNHDDWSYGCEPAFYLSCDKDEYRFLRLPHAEFFGYDFHSLPNYTFTDCQNLCLQRCECKGFEYSFSFEEGSFYCYTKTLLTNGYQVPSYSGDTYLRLPRNYRLSHEESKLNCSDRVIRHAKIKSRESQSVRFVFWFATGVGGLEIVSILFVWCVLIRSQQNSIGDARSNILANARFKRFSFAELKKATRGFSQEIGRGSEGTVYKGILSDSRVAAIKRLNEASCQGEAEFLAELSTIGRLNHMNLIEMWGYCTEGNHRLLVYEYLEHGSLKENLSSRNVLDWTKRFEIAVGTAKGLAYLHEECLEWILHCDVKPQNILLNSNYQPKVADFGLSKLFKRGELRKPSFSRIRGTRGYMAPEWVTNQSITSKVDVYSYGVVVLEILTGKSPTAIDGTEETELRGLVKWVKEMGINGSSETTSYWVEKIMDPQKGGEYDVEKMETLLEVALECIKEDKDARPTMSQVVKMLLHHDNY